ncbi:MAG: helix-turn-helix transcriptional regulator [Alphaproteobacteria bacterium]
MLLEDCGAVVSALRSHAFMTQAELAEMMLRSPAEVAAIEEGQQPLVEADLRALARIFGLNEARLMQLARPANIGTKVAA